MTESDRAVIKTLILEVLTEVLTQKTTPIAAPIGGWVDLKEAVSPLGYSSYSSLRRDVSAGLFREGKEVRDRRKPGNQKPRYQINIEAAQKRLIENPDRRRSV